jgi:hypothetical protein
MIQVILPCLLYLSSLLTIPTTTIDLQMMALDLEALALAQASEQGFDLTLLEIHHLVAVGADNVVMVGAATEDVAMAAHVVEVDTLEDAYFSEQVEGAKHCGPPNVGCVALHSIQQLGGGETFMSTGNDADDGATWLGQPITSVIQLSQQTCCRVTPDCFSAHELASSLLIDTVMILTKRPNVKGAATFEL